jgi:hypothetical protein
MFSSTVPSTSSSPAPSLPSIQETPSADEATLRARLIEHERLAVTSAVTAAVTVAETAAEQIITKIISSSEVAEEATGKIMSHIELSTVKAVEAVEALAERLEKLIKPPVLINNIQQCSTRSSFFKRKYLLYFLFFLQVILMLWVLYHYFFVEKQEQQEQQEQKSYLELIFSFFTTCRNICSIIYSSK